MGSGLLWRWWAPGSSCGAPRHEGNRVQVFLRVMVAVVVTAACLYFSLRGAEWSEVRRAISGTRYEWVAIMMVAMGSTIYVRALRWRILLGSVGRLPLQPLFSATAVGFMANLLLPLRAGEIIRPVLLGRETRVPTTAAFASVLLERLLDLMLIFCFLLAISVAVPVPHYMQRASYVMAGVIAGLLATMLVLLRRQERAVARIRRTLSRFGVVGQGVTDVFESFLTGVASISDVRTGVLLFGYSLAVWTVIASTFGFGLLALNVDAPLAAGSVSLMVIIAAFVSLPQAPGYVGTWQAGCVWALALYGVSQEEAIGYSLVTHVAQLLVIVGLGAVCLATSRVRPGELVSLAQRAEQKKL